MNGLPQASFNALAALFSAFNIVVLPILRANEDRITNFTQFLTVLLTLPDELVWAPSSKLYPHIEIYQDFMIKLMDFIGSGITKPMVERAVMQLALVKNCSVNTIDAVSSPSNASKNHQFGTMFPAPNVAPISSPTIQSKTELNSRYSNALRLLRAVVFKLPQCKNLIGSCLLARFSIETMSIDQCIAYLKNLFRMTTFSSDVQEMILSLVVERLMNLDSKLRLDSETVAQLNQSQYSSPGSYSPGSVSPSPNDSQFSSIHHHRSVKRHIDQFHLNPSELTEQERLIYLAEKLDSCMKIVFDYLQRSSHLENCEEVMKCLFTNFLSIFSNSILRTYELNSTQFVMFYICSFNKEFGRNFIHFLFQRIFDESMYPEARRVSIAYAGSFLARAKFLDENVILESLNSLLLYLRSYIDRKEVKEIDIEKHTVFYNVAQCFFYVLCYHIDIIQEQCNPGFSLIRGGHSELSHVNIHPFLQQTQSLLKAVLQSSLNPLRVIPKDVTQQIVRALLYYGIVDCREIIHQGLRVPVRNHRLSKFLEQAYFPFDPYVLRESREFIEPLYRQWGSPIYKFPTEIENQLQLLLTRHSDSSNFISSYGSSSITITNNGVYTQLKEDEYIVGSLDSSYTTFTEEVDDIMDENGTYSDDDDFDDDDDDVFGVKQISNF